MKTLTLGRTDISVTDWCLGTMTFGNQTPMDDAHRQIDMALDAGLNFMDCAEMYPVNPVSKETVGRSEEFLGAWFEKSGRRNDWVLATKVAGPNPGWTRDGAGYDGANIEGTIDAACRTKRRGARPNGAIWQSSTACRAWPQSRMNIRCCAATSTPTCRKPW